MICVQGLPMSFSTDTDVRISVGLKFLWGMVGNKNLKMFVRETIIKKSSHH